MWKEWLLRDLVWYVFFGAFGLREFLGIDDELHFSRKSIGLS